MAYKLAKTPDGLFKQIKPTANVVNHDVNIDGKKWNERDVNLMPTRNEAYLIANTYEKPTSWSKGSSSGMYLPAQWKYRPKNPAPYIAKFPQKKTGNEMADSILEYDDIRDAAEELSSVVSKKYNMDDENEYEKGMAYLRKNLLKKYPNSAENIDEFLESEAMHLFE